MSDSGIKPNAADDSTDVSAFMDDISADIGADAAPGVKPPETSAEVAGGFVRLAEFIKKKEARTQKSTGMLPAKKVLEPYHFQTPRVKAIQSYQAERDRFGSSEPANIYQLFQNNSD